MVRDGFISKHLLDLLGGTLSVDWWTTQALPGITTQAQGTASPMILHLRPRGVELGNEIIQLCVVFLPTGSWRRPLRQLQMEPLSFEVSLK